MCGFILGLNELGFDSSPLLLLCFAGVILEHMVHLFEGSTLGFRHKEESPDSGEHTEDGKEDVGTVSGVLDEWWGDETLPRLGMETLLRGTKVTHDDEVVKPVGTC